MCAQVIFGRSASKLIIDPPKSEPLLDPNTSPVAYLPDEPDLFIGQNDAMLAANRALAPGSAQFGVLFWGGTGKTWCATELAHRHQRAFEALVYWRFPPGQPFNDGFSSLAKAWEQQLSQYGFSMVKEVVTSSALEAYLPRLRVLLRDHGLLIVLDGVDPLLTADGVWRDPRWPALVDVLTGHRGESRVVFTSRSKPSRLDLPTIEIQRIGPLSRYESLHLARQLPTLGLWLNDELPVAGDALGGTRREVALGLLNRWQGHPQLLAYADMALSPGVPLPDDNQIVAAASAAAVAADGTGPVPDAASIEQTLLKLVRLRPAEGPP
jgi:hypothetical protein